MSDLQDILDELPVGVVVVGVEGDVRFSNSTARRIAGEAGLSDLVNARNVHEPGTNKRYPVGRYPLVRALAGEPASADVELHRAGLAPIVLELSAKRIVTGGSDAIVAVFTDVTQPRRREEALRSVLDSANDAYIAIDPDSRIVDWNPQAERTFGWPRREAVGRTLTELIMPPRYRIAHARGLERYLETGEGPVLYKTVQLEALDRDGREFPVELTIWPTGLGPEQLFHAFLRDITDRRLAEETTRRLAAIVESSENAVFSCQSKDEDNVVTSWNRAAEKLYGYTSEQIEGRSVSTLLPPDRERDELRVLEGVLAGEVAHDHETELVRHDGELIAVALTISPVRTATGKVAGVSVVARDLTEVRRADAAERRVREREVEAATLRQLNESKDVFVTAFSHELRTPLQSIMGYTKLLEKRADTLPPQYLEVIEALQSNAARLNRLMQDVMDVDRVKRGVIYARRLPTNVGEVVGRVIARADPGTHTVHLETKPMPAEVDPSLLERILEHLFINALKYTPAGSNIWIRNERIPDGVLLTVEDDGPGVPDNVKGRLFDEFQHGVLHEHDPGLGLGLSVVHRFAALHDGRSWIEDRAGGGACFKVLLGEGGAAPPPAPASSGRRDERPTHV